MQKKLLAVAVAGALAAPAAYAQTSVTISGALNLWYESAASTGATIGGQGDLKSRDRIVDGAGSNIRFTVVEDIGGGMQAFGQVESAVFNNADTRNDAMNNGQAVGGWANRNSGVGLRSSAWGEILMGIWDVHYNEHYAADSHIIRGASNSNLLGLLNTFGTQGSGSRGSSSAAAGVIPGVVNSNPAGTTGGTAASLPNTQNPTGTFAPTIGARYGNVIRYQSPTWSGFNFRLAYVRPTDGIPNNTDGGVGTNGTNTKNRTWNFAPSYSAGPIFLGASFLRDKDIAVTTSGTNGEGIFLWGGATAGGVTIAGPTGGFTATSAATVLTSGFVGAPNFAGRTTTLLDIRSDRFTGAYTFPMGLKIGFIYDRSRMDINTGAATSQIKRDVWGIPLAFTTGAHQFHFNYGVAKSWKGNIGGTDLSSITITPNATVPGATTTYNAGSNTGAKMIALGYQYDLSKRTNLHLTYAQIRNESLAGYDFFSAPVGLVAGSYGSDPRVYSIGLRHAF